jgi:hypothetical protein
MSATEMSARDAWLGVGRMAGCSAKAAEGWATQIDLDNRNVEVFWVGKVATRRA